MKKVRKRYQRINCPKCEFNSGQEKRLYEHLKEKHQITDIENLYVQVMYSGKTPLCKCGCKKPLTFKNWKQGFTSNFIRGHNASIDNPFSDPEKMKEIVKKRKKNYQTGKYKVWNDGLTKETDERIAKGAKKTSKTLNEGYKSGRLIDWRKNDPEKLRIVAKKASKTFKERYASGKLIPWNKGKTKHDDERVAKISQNLKKHYETIPYHFRHSSDELESILERYAIPNNIKLITPIDEYQNKTQYLEFQCKICKTLMKKTLPMLKNCPRCFTCHPKESFDQLEIYRFILSLGIDAISNDRNIISPRELDIYVPSHRLGIEFNGLYWHSQAIIKNENYHVEKMELCNKNNVSLLMIFEDEWRDKQNVIKGMIRQRLGKQTNKLDARKLSIRQLNKDEAKQFFEENHLEGNAKSKITFGLIDNDKIVAATSLRRPFHKKYEKYLELGRSCSHRDINVRGWLGKLTKELINYAKNNDYEGIISYVDSRVGLGKSYESVGWNLIKKTKARFWWTNFVNRMNRFQYKADKSRNMSQDEIAKEAGVVPIFGCSNSLWQIKV